MVRRWCSVVSAQPASAQPSAQTFTLEQALQFALDHYPSIRSTLEQVNASAANVDVAKAAYWPRLDSLWQTNRATANNIFGQLLPQSVIPALSGPALPSTSADSVWGSAAGALFSWEPVDFGLRSAVVREAQESMRMLRRVASFVAPALLIWIDRDSSLASSAGERSDARRGRVRAKRACRNRRRVCGSDRRNGYAARKVIQYAGRVAMGSAGDVQVKDVVVNGVVVVRDGRQLLDVYPGQPIRAAQQ